MEYLCNKSACLVLVSFLFGSLLSSVYCASPPDSARRLLRNRTLASDDKKVDEELLASRNSQVPVGQKKTLFDGKNVYVDKPLRVHFYVTQNGQEVPRADADFESAVVCSGEFSIFDFDARKWNYFLCPTSGGFASASYKGLLADGLGAAVYCCHSVGSQKCCTKEEFMRWHGEFKNTEIKAIIIFAIVVSCVVFLAGVVGVSICICCLCKCGFEVCKRGRSAALTRGYVVGGSGPGAGGYGAGAGGYGAGAGGYGAGAGGYGAGAGGSGPDAGGYGAGGGGYDAGGGRGRGGGVLGGLARVAGGAFRSRRY